MDMQELKGAKKYVNDMVEANILEPEENYYLKILLSLAQSVLDTGDKMKKEDFEYYLTEKHAEQYIGTKDCMIDDYEKWVCDLGTDELIELGNRFAKDTRDKQILWLTKKMMGLEDKIAKNLLPFADGEWRKDFPDNWKWDKDTLTRLSKMIANAIRQEIV